MNSSSDHFCGCSTSPSTSNDQVARSISGVPCASSTGHFLVRDCPGGMRLSRRVSGLMMSASVISSGLRGSAVWYFGSLIRLLRKLIAKFWLALLCFVRKTEFCDGCENLLLCLMPPPLTSSPYEPLFRFQVVPVTASKAGG